MGTGMTAAVLVGVMIGGVTGGMVVHEVGHYAACRYFGYESTIIITLSSSLVPCEATGMERTVMLVAGGGTASLVFLAAMMPRVMRQNCHIRLFLLVGVTTQIINVIIEAGLNQWYNDMTRAMMLAAGLGVAMWIERHHLARRRPA